MSDRIFPLRRVSSLNANQFSDQWIEVCQERGDKLATIGLLQLIIDVLKQSCNNSDGGDFELPKTIDLVSFDMGFFIKYQICQKGFDTALQKQNDTELALLIATLVKRSNNVEWMRHVLNLLCVLSKKKKTQLLVTKTLICFYTEALIVQNDPNTNRRFRRQLQDICQRLSSIISQEQRQECDALKIMVKIFFDRIDTYPELIQYDRSGFAAIIAMFLAVEDYDINIDTLTRVIQFGESGIHGRAILLLCADQPILKTLSLCTNLCSIKLQKLSLQLAQLVQRAAGAKRLFKDEVFSNFVLSNNNDVRILAADLCREMIKQSTSNVPEATSVLIFATHIYQRFCSIETKYKTRLTSVFFDEFTNWTSFFEAIEIRLPNRPFLNELFQLMKHITNQLKNLKENELLRSNSHSAIQFLQKLDRQQNVEVCASINLTILEVDPRLEQINSAHCEILAKIIQETSLDIFTTYAKQRNVILIIKNLIRRGFVSDEFGQALVDRCWNERLSQLQILQENIDFDTNQIVLQTTMKLSVFAEFQLMNEKASLLCIQSNDIVMNNRFDLVQNRTFLAYNITSLVETCIIEFVNARGTLPTSIRGISRTKIADRLLDILDKTLNDLDILCKAAFWGLCRMEYHFKSVSTKQPIDTLTQYVVRKVSICEMDQPNRNTMVHRELVEHMLIEIQKLMLAGRSLSVCDLAIACHKIFPDYNFALDLLTRCAEMGLYDMLSDCVIGILNGIRTKKSKEEFVKMITPIVRSMPVLDQFRDQLKRIGVKSTV